ncbi:FAD-dependent oxidoreductase [Caproiciproducens faecalis]|uniref:FAD-dependent oxidoreductase n=1 Tax=Caproiciproducens faecalis TaxID=2820301 RepID=A0ABS7DKW1_9FIRM|nr:FAD-dependent oxidoreductase [Caproiciproducens faecalis]MBW7571746.1 FAD-dependent oxidoreductase [Caproiciproducens faecalis]
MKSIWSETCTFPKRDPLKNDIVVDTAVIGAGMAGLLTAYLLQEEGQKVVVLEAAETASGVTKNTTAKITSQHDLIYDSMIQDFGEEAAGQYAAANQKAVEKFRTIITESKIDCDFESKPSFVYSLDREEELKAEAQAAEKLGIPAEFTTETDLPFPVLAAVKFSNQAQFHPLKFLNSISSGLTIFENTRALIVRGDSIITNRGRVTADHIVVATHFPIVNVPGWYFARMHQERSYVIALKNAGQLKGMYIDADPDGYSFRSYGDYIFLGGAGHRTGKHPESGCYEKLRKAAKQYFPESEEVCHWSAQDCMTWDNLPYIGQYASSTPNLYVATGFKKWGMSTSMAAAMILTDTICGRENEEAEVFSPQRFHAAASAKNMMTDFGTSAVELTAGLFSPPKRRCAHLGCRLQWNPDEETWDCPCHGSRFTEQGDLISDPALRGIKHD